MWKRETTGLQATSVVFTISTVFGILFLLFGKTWVASLLVLIAFITYAQKKYFEQVGSKLLLHNLPERSYLVAGSESAWKLTFQNNGLPIWNGTIRLTFSDVVSPLTNNGTKPSGKEYEIVVPFSIGTKKEVVVTIPLKGEKRGITRIQKLEIAIPHLFGEGMVYLHFEPFISKQQMVFPSIKPLHTKRFPTPKKPGEYDFQPSLYVDLFSPVGTREYAAGDQLNHIHWNATARTGSLQTKVFNQVANESVLLVVNVADSYSIVPYLEALLEEAASYIEHYFQTAIPFSLAINVRAYGSSPYVYLPIGTGEIHRRRALELLAVLSQNDVTIPFSQMLRHLDGHNRQAHFIQVFGTKSSDTLFDKWKKSSRVEFVLVDEGVKIR
ncbi:DUF58 domain-containing protein [Paenisporosarcina cavernae]|nr:DUF58 domain-containing protein [Paenisporosarcina cavernae]